MKEVAIIEKLERSSAVGPQPAFSKYDILKTLEVMLKSGCLGRKKLSNLLHRGEGSTRTIIEHLQMASMIRITKNGCELTDKGKRLAQKLMDKIGKQAQLPENILVAGKFAYGILIKNAASKVKYGIEQRDAAVKIGAKSATTILCKHRHLIMPPETESTPKELSELLSTVYSEFNPQENDVIIICGADDPVLAEVGARASLWTLLQD